MKSKGETPSKAKNHPLKRQGMLSSGRKKLMQRKEQVTKTKNQKKPHAHQRKPITINETTTNTTFKNKQPTITEQNTLSRKSKDDNRVWKRQKLSM